MNAKGMRRALRISANSKERSSLPRRMSTSAAASACSAMADFPSVNEPTGPSGRKPSSAINEWRSSPMIGSSSTMRIRPGSCWSIEVKPVARANPYPKASAPQSSHRWLQHRTFVHTATLAAARRVPSGAGQPTCQRSGCGRHLATARPFACNCRRCRSLAFPNRCASISTSMPRWSTRSCSGSVCCAPKCCQCLDETDDHRLLS